jgi:hypothetical protein
MIRHPLLAVLLLLLPALFLCPHTRAQSKKMQEDPRALVKPDPKKAKRFVEQAAKEEAAGAYDAALEDYEEAARYAPFDVTIVSKGVALRSKLVRAYVDSCEQLALDGNLEGAVLQLAAALRIDPRNTIVRERLHQLEVMRGDRKEEPIEEPPLGLPKLDPLKTTKSFNLRTDVKDAYEQIAAAFGIKASFDPDLPARNVRVRLEDVDFATAMKVLAAETNSFWRPLNPKLIFVAADTSEKRKEFDMQIEQTYVLPASVESTDMTELVRVVREITGIQHIQQSLPAHTVTIRDSVQKVHLAAEIIRDIEQARGEMLLEIDLLEVDNSNAIKLGITPSSSVRLISLDPGLARQARSAQSITALLTLLAGIFGGPLGSAATSGVTSLASAIPPIAAIGGGKSTFLLTLPNASADFSQALSLVHSGRQVLLRAQDGKPATFFVGERFPITLSLLSGSLGATGFVANPGGTGIAIPTQQFTVGQGPVGLLTTDFRTSGAQDLAVLNEIDNTITILLNQGTGATPQFAPAPSSPISLGTARTTAPNVPAAFAVGSLNSKTDSFPDLLVTNPDANTVTLLLANSAGDGSFTVQPNPIAVGNSPSAIAVGTFNTNTDSNLGFVVTNFGDTPNSTYSVFTGNADGTFTQVIGSPFPLPSTEKGAFAIAVADFNNDGKQDLAIVNETSKNVTLLKGNGDGTFTEFPNSPIPVGNLPVAVAAGSLAGSTGPALAVVNQQDSTITVLLGNGDGTFALSPQSPLTTSATPSGVVIGNFLNGSAGGIAVSNTGAGTVTVFLDIGSGLFTSAVEPGAGTNPGAIVSGDFTNETFPDIAVANNLSGTAGQVTLLQSPASLISNPEITQSPYPGSEYVDIGLKVKATPSLHDNDEVTLQLDFEIKSIGTASVNGIPVISNRSVTQTVRLKEDETSLLTGLLDKEETKTITGIPGLATLPVAGYAFGRRDNSFTDDELLILITPRRLRLPRRESRSVYAGQGDIGGRGSAGAAAPLTPTPQPSPEPAPQPNEPGPAPAPTPTPTPAPTPAPPPGPPPLPEPEPTPQEQPSPPPQS